VIEKYAMESGEGLKVFEPAARDLLIEYDWPGNARQLVYTIQALMDLSNSSFISRKDVEKYLSFSGKLPDESFGFNAQLKEMKKLIIIKALSQTEFNVAAAARILSLDRSNLFKMIKELGIKTG
jgi:DNA-binding NtrC family response regulator